MRLIDADDFIEKMRELYEQAKWGKREIHFSLADLECNVDMMPSAQPERKKGKWLFPYTDRRYKKCSECGREYYSIPHDSNYCPNCGADMRGEDNG